MLVKCGMCYLNCLEKICDYMNASAYSYMAVSGKNFCSSAWSGFMLQIKHLMKFSFANMIAAIFIFLGKIGITVGNCFSLLFIMKTITKDMDEISSVYGPVAVVAVFTYFTATVFLGLFDTAVLTLMTCLAIDMDLNNGTPKYGPETFHDNMKKVDKKSKEYQANKVGNDMA